MLDVKKKKKKENDFIQKSKLCFSCGAKGHVIRDCPFELKGQYNGKEKDDFSPINDCLLAPEWKEESDSLPCIKVHSLTQKRSEDCNPLPVIKDRSFNHKMQGELDPSPVTKDYPLKQEGREEHDPLYAPKVCPLKQKGQEEHELLHATKDGQLERKGQDECDPLLIKPSKNDKPTSQYQCYGCGSIGHQKNNCPQRKDLKYEKTFVRTHKSIQSTSSFDEGKSSDRPAISGVTVPFPDEETKKFEGKSSDQQAANGATLQSPVTGTKLFEGKWADLLETEKVENRTAHLQTVNNIDKVPAPTLEPEILEDLEFAWGKKGGVGGKKREIQFYKSFTYDGVEYSLHDCVYMQKEGEPKPYIGKLIKIWQHTDKSKKVKVQWFFHPEDISCWLGNDKVLDNELFIASGVGTGLANVNFLEAIGGKCNIICISKDSRNPQPSAEKIKMADYVFYRTFDVSTSVISDKMDEKVGGLECKFIFNRIGSEVDDVIPMLKSHMLENEQNGEVSIEPLQNLPEKSKTINSAEKMNSSTSNLNDGIRFTEESENRPSKKARVDKPTDIFEAENKKMVQGLPVRGKDDRTTLATECLKDKSTGLAEGNDKKTVQHLHVGRNDKNKLLASASLEEKITYVQAKDKHTELVEGKNKNDAQDLPVRGNDVKNLLNSASLKGKIVPAQIKDKYKIEDKNKKGSKDSLVHENVEKKSVGSGSKDSHVHDNIVGGSLKEKQHIVTQGKDKSTEKRQGKEKNMDQGSLVGKDDEQKFSSSAPYKDKPTSTKAKDSHATLKRVKSATEGGDLKSKSLSKKARLEESCENLNNPNKTFDRNNSKDFTKLRIVKDSSEANRLILDEEVSNGKLNKALSSESAGEDIGVVANAYEVTRRLDAVKASWFEKTPWEERMQKAHEKETLVLLQNLDPSYTSEEVEDIIWRAFKISCDAKMLQRNAFSSPHVGQALIILKTKDAVSKVINKLDEEILMLVNGRPLVACIAPPPCLAKQESAFFGHLVIDNLKNQNQKETKEALSTSHCSQPNTIEYEMAMEWCLLQSRSDSWWKRLYKQQGAELRKLKAQLKSK